MNWGRGTGAWIAWVGLGATAAGGLGPQVSAPGDAVRLVSEGRLSQALKAARAEVDPLVRAQAELHVLHHGGRLDSALQAGLSGLRAAPEDPWLLEQSAYIALSLGAGELAMDLGQRLREHMPPVEWPRLSWMLTEARALEQQRLAEARALKRSRTAVGAGLLACCLTLVFVGLSARGS